RGDPACSGRFSSLLQNSLARFGHDGSDFVQNAQSLLTRFAGKNLAQFLTYRRPVLVEASYQAAPRRRERYAARAGVVRAHFAPNQAPLLEPHHHRRHGVGVGEQFFGKLILANALPSPDGPQQRALVIRDLAQPEDRVRTALHGEMRAADSAGW